MSDESATQEKESPRAPFGTPSPKAQSWGVVVSIAVIVAMIVIGAYYSWNKRAAEGIPSAAATTSIP